MPNPRSPFAEDAVEVGPLLAADRDEGWPLARSVWPEATLHGWRAFDRWWRSGGEARGAIAVRNGRGALLGLAYWRREPDGTLVAGPMTARELGVRPIVRRALVARLEAMAGDLGAVLRLDETASP